MSGGTTSALVSANRATDYTPGHMCCDNPGAHWIALGTTPGAGRNCQQNAEEYFMDQLTKAAGRFLDCLRSCPHQRSRGREGITALGHALHNAQDRRSHHCMTAWEHDEVDADNPVMHSRAYAAARADTFWYLAAMYVQLLVEYSESAVRTCFLTVAWQAGEAGGGEGGVIRGHNSEEDVSHAVHGDC